MLINDDCLKALKNLDDDSIDMVYLDPPFFTQKNQRLSDAKGKKYEFSDVWNSKEEYLLYIKERLVEIKRVIKPNGNIFLHCDSTASHHLRVLMDEVFGEKNFRSEIIWTYRRWSNSKKGLLAGHQTIYYYSKTKQYKFNTLYGDYSPTTNLDQILQERVRDGNGKASYKKDEAGNIVWGKEKNGVPLSDVWDIPFLNPKARERTGYPTQKPVELLERIIKISTDENDLVLDPFCGSGTTLVAAKRLERKYIGIDINPEAIILSEKRLNHPIKTESNLLKVGIKAYQTKTAEELAILQSIDCDIVQRNRGIDAILKKHYMGAPVAIKIQKESENIIDAIKYLDEAGKKRKCSFLVLIVRDTIDPGVYRTVPQNMIILKRYKEDIDAKLEKMCEK